MSASTRDPSARPVLSEASPSPANTAHVAAGALMVAASALFAAATEHAAGNDVEATAYAASALESLLDALARDPFKGVVAVGDRPGAEACRAALDAAGLLAFGAGNIAAGEPDMGAVTDLARRRLIEAAAALPEPSDPSAHASA